MMGRKQMTEVERLSTPLTEIVEATPAAMRAIEKLVSWLTETVFNETCEECEDLGPVARARLSRAAISQTLQLLNALSNEEWLDEIAKKVRARFNDDAALAKADGAKEEGGR